LADCLAGIGLIISLITPNRTTDGPMETIMETIRMETMDGTGTDRPLFEAAPKRVSVPSARL
jgi:hypothetical protein